MKREFTFSDVSGEVRLAVFISVFESWHMVQYYTLMPPCFYNKCFDYIASVV